jgi:hypothetical protein
MARLARSAEETPSDHPVAGFDRRVEESRVGEGPGYSNRVHPCRCSAESVSRVEVLDGTGG